MRLAIATLGVVLGGCSVVLTGEQTAGSPHARVTGTAVSTQGQTGSTRVSGSFGAPAPAGSASGRVSLPRGATAGLVLGLVIADLVHHLTSGTGGAPVRTADRAIADTCSCYGYRPPEEQTHSLLSDHP
ncbi:MAG: hypothetical protein ACT4P8_17860 [Betaproteobacteria bacterium]